jgi:gamma-glutamylcyclotransferase (GGCT)/AIG2-like uncharacterized protein YtfP
MPDHCFTYGSLMCEDIMARVSGVMLREEPALLPDHARHPVQGEDYPGMVPATGLAVSGILYRNLPTSAWPRLDEFEGGMYERRQVSVQLGNGEKVEAWTYLFRPDLAHLLLPGEWDFQRFLAEGKARFARHYLGFGLLEGHETE